MSKQNSIVYKKAFSFSVRIVNLYKYLCNEKKEYVLAKQLLRSGTSIAANIREGLEGQSRKDFVAKLSISLKEAVETEYWLELLIATDILSENNARTLLSESEELIKMLTSIIKTTKLNAN
ncbi:MAG: four helix bundle protein [Bacillota bacterium]